MIELENPSLFPFFCLPFLKPENVEQYFIEEVGRRGREDVQVEFLELLHFHLLHGGKVLQ